VVARLVDFDTRRVGRYALLLVAALVAAQFAVGLAGSLRPSRPHAVVAPPAPPALAPLVHPRVQVRLPLVVNQSFDRNGVGWHDSCGGCGTPALAVDHNRSKLSSASLKVTASGIDQATDYWNVPVRPGRHYAASAWVFQASGGPATIRLRCAENGGPAYWHQQEFTVPSGAWTHLTLVFATSPSARVVSDFQVINRQNGPLTFWLADVTLKRVPAP
jgi:hypothetical protein